MKHFYETCPFIDTEFCGKIELEGYDSKKEILAQLRMKAELDYD